MSFLKELAFLSRGRELNEYPHQLSGGMRQRVMIAMALSCDPKLLIADEPTTALDVTIQAQILELLEDLEKDFGMSIMMITHDLGVIAEISHRIAVMYAGKVMEYTTVENLYNNPSHPYTWGLMRSIPKIHKKVEELEAIPGVVPSPLDFPEGCKFNSRCFMAEDKCFEKEPPLRELNGEHKSRCWYIDELKKKQSKFQSA
ncbi:oligopeptide/dipeptide ABC transporter, ATP-binding protein, C-terminal domain-containing protein [Halarsenatibacter silvermanii]|uniref:Oligopeptide/dipeptide ABC transporter, ATP-binding protein, C-terminal domain-containing protein n=1 Tax=Halarsenatibacter silvermanii TaxID=321763 RepID=A0A1G9P7G2_9FIRM|nr:oligopeptide/dipeptide ABC transporter, ATP-binding protein, C-terminal domain-containing protein [Halarsenatibacter silvermanii]